MTAKKIGTLTIPEPGFYQHYKRNPTGPKFNFIYEVIAVGEERDTKVLYVFYRRMYGRRLRRGCYFVRPLEVFTARVRLGTGSISKMVQRYARITDPALVKELEAERRHRYPAPT